MDLDDGRWPTLHGGYRVPYDASVPLTALERSEDLQPIWRELWNELHHQGDVGVASYASIPHLARIAKSRNLRDWNVYALAATIECARHDGHNPPLPEWLAPGYHAAWKDLIELGLAQLATTTDELTTRSILAVIAIAKGFRKLGRVLCDYDASEIEALYESLYESGG